MGITRVLIVASQDIDRERDIRARAFCEMDERSNCFPVSLRLFDSLAHVLFILQLRAHGKCARCHVIDIDKDECEYVAICIVKHKETWVGMCWGEPVSCKFSAQFYVLSTWSLLQSIQSPVQQPYRTKKCADIPDWRFYVDFLFQVCVEESGFHVELADGELEVSCLRDEGAERRIAAYRSEGIRAICSGSLREPLRHDAHFLVTIAFGK